MVLLCFCVRNHNLITAYTGYRIGGDVSRFQFRKPFFQGGRNIGYENLAGAEITDRTSQFPCINAANTGDIEFLHNLRQGGGASEIGGFIIIFTDDDYERDTPTLGALIVREYNDEPSNFRSTATLSEVMKKFSIPGIYGIDTRKLNRSIRDFGSRKVLITDVSTTLEEGLAKLKSTNIPTDAVSHVSCDKIMVSHAETQKFHVVAIDCGMKMNIVRSLNKRGCKVTIVPWNTPAEAIVALEPDGIFISNGPGDPTDVPETTQTIKKLIGKYPIFGICLGHQIISLAYGAKTYKLKFGHRGGNHPVRNLETGKIEITSQNHSYAVDMI